MKNATIMQSPSIHLNSFAVQSSAWIRQAFTALSTTAESYCITRERDLMSVLVAPQPPHRKRVGRNVFSLLPARRFSQSIQFSSSLVFSESHEKKRSQLMYRNFYFFPHYFSSLTEKIFRPAKASLSTRKASGKSWQSWPTWGKFGEGK